MQSKLILASQSPRRVALLKQIGLEASEIFPTHIDESVQGIETPKAHALRLAKEKALACLKAQHDLSAPCVVLAADTVVGVGRRILPKAETVEQARFCLELLSGRHHSVYTAVVCVNAQNIMKERVVHTKVRFKKLDASELQSYLQSGEWQGKAGGYGIQGLAAKYISSLNGSYSAVVGLPLHESAMLLRSFGFNV